MIYIMILQTIGIILFDSLGIYAGYRFAKLKKPYWAFGYFIGLAIMLFIRIPVYIPSLYFSIPFKWFLSGRTEFVFTGFCAAIMLSTCMWKTDRKSYKTALPVFMTVILVYYSISPFALPGILFNKHKNLQTKINEEGICMQTTGYTCGPAAAVTALRNLGIDAEEGEIAIACNTTISAGTQPDSLQDGLLKLYSNYGLHCEYRFFTSIQELEPNTVVIVKYKFMVDHYVTVLKVTETLVIVGDPLVGIKNYPHDSFILLWRKQGVILKKELACL